MEKRRVVITGLGAVTPVGLTAAESWEAVKAGKCGIGPITLYDASNMKAKLAGEVKGFDPANYMEKREARKVDRFAQFALAAAQEAVEQSGLDFAKEDPYRCAIIMSAGIGGLITLQNECVKGSQKGFDKISPFFIPMAIGNMASAHIAIKYGLKGMATCPTTACAGGTNAVGDALRQVRDGYADVVLCGGAEAVVTELAMGGFTSMHALHTGDDPAAASIPFDARRSGFVMGEGGAALILEEYEHAKARGARIYAEIVGYGATDDAHHMTAPDPEGNGGARAIRMAYEEAGADIANEKIYINAHGTSTPLNERSETVAIKKAFDGHVENVVVSSTKSMTGHMLGAAGAVEAIASALAVREGIVPPTINYKEPDPECDLDVCPNVARRMDIDLALSVSLGFGGHNACIAIRKVL